jgi:hypothetical protein
MATGHTGLRTQVEKLIGTTRCDSMHVSGLKRSRVGCTRCVCIQIEWPTGSFSLSFYYHSDGRWRLFPPAKPPRDEHAPQGRAFVGGGLRVDAGKDCPSLAHL